MCVWEEDGEEEVEAGREGGSGDKPGGEDTHTRITKHTHAETCKQINTCIMQTHGYTHVNTCITGRTNTHTHTHA